MLHGQIERFLVVAELKSFSKAAEILFISSPALSQQISALEQRIGVQLFCRTNKGVSLTPAGESFYEDAKKMMEMSQGAIRNARILSGIMENSITIGIIGAEAYQIVPSTMSAFKNLYPKVDIRLQKTTRSTVKADLRLRAIDICFAYSESSFESKDISYSAIVQDKIVCVIPTGHKLAARAGISIADLRGETLLFLEEGVSIGHDQLRHDIVSREPNICFQSGIAEISLNIASRITRTHPCICLSLMAPVDDSRKVKPFEYDALIELGVFYRKEYSPLIKEFIKITKNTLSDIVKRQQFD